MLGLNQNEEEDGYRSGLAGLGGMLGSRQSKRASRPKLISMPFASHPF